MTRCAVRLSWGTILGILAGLPARDVVGQERRDTPKVGDHVVMVEAADAMIEKEVAARVPVGAVFVVQRIQGEWVWPGLSQPGWLPMKAVASLDEGERRLSTAIAKDARNAQAIWGRGEIRRAKGEWDKAIADFDEVIRLAPASPLGYLSRGACQFERGRLEEARADLDRAIELDERSVAAFQFRKRIHAARGEDDKALADANRAVELAPKDAGSLNGRAWLRATSPDDRVRNGAAAVADAEAACELTGHLHYRHLGTLAAALAEAGRFEDAVKRQKQAIELAPSEERADYEKRLALYESGKPFRVKTDR